MSPIEIAKKFVEWSKVRPAHMVGPDVADAYALAHAFIAQDALLKEAVKVIEAILKNVSTDWYMQQFGRDDTPNKNSSGIAAQIHNLETFERIKTSFIRAKEFLARFEKGKV